jgi:undecaprenyl-diphosphatase
MNILDLSVIQFLNQFAHHSQSFDLLTKDIADNNLFKGGLFAICFWWLWFKPNIDQARVRTSLISTLLGGIIAIGFARVLVLMLPFRTRPILNHDLNLIAPFYNDGAWFDKLSSFPSDHATLFFGLAVGLYTASKQLGFLALLYTFMFIALPRIYHGLHYPTDILAGAFIGISIVCLVHTQWVTRNVSSKIYALFDKNAQISYALMFLITFQISNLFIDLRHLVRMFMDLVKLTS